MNLLTVAYWYYAYRFGVHCHFSVSKNIPTPWELLSEAHILVKSTKNLRWLIIYQFANKENFISWLKIGFFKFAKKRPKLTLSTYEAPIIFFSRLAVCNNLDLNVMLAREDASVEDFRTTVKQICSKDNKVLTCCYDRAVLGQSGQGHFTPIGMYVYWLFLWASDKVKN